MKTLTQLLGGAVLGAGLFLSSAQAEEQDASQQARADLEQLTAHTRAIDLKRVIPCLRNFVLDTYRKADSDAIIELKKTLPPDWVDTMERGKLPEELKDYFEQAGWTFRQPLMGGFNFELARTSSKKKKVTLGNKDEITLELITVRDVVIPSRIAYNTKKKKVRLSNMKEGAKIYYYPQTTREIAQEKYEKIKTRKDTLERTIASPIMFEELSDALNAKRKHISINEISSLRIKIKHLDKNITSAEDLADLNKTRWELELATTKMKQHNKQAREHASLLIAALEYRALKNHFGSSKTFEAFYKKVQDDWVQDVLVKYASIKRDEASVTGKITNEITKHMLIRSWLQQGIMSRHPHKVLANIVERFYVGPKLGRGKIAKLVLTNLSKEARAHPEAYDSIKVRNDNINDSMPSADPNDVRALFKNTLNTLYEGKPFGEWLKDHPQPQNKGVDGGFGKI